MTTPRLPADITPCAGGGWDECADCLRRTAPGGEVPMTPPPIVTFVCEYYIEPAK